MEAQALQRRSFTLKEFCARNGIHRDTAYEEKKRGRLRMRKVGAKNIITAEDEQAWLDSLLTSVHPRRKPAKRTARK